MEIFSPQHKTHLISYTTTVQWQTNEWTKRTYERANDRMNKQLIDSKSSDNNFYSSMFHYNLVYVCNEYSIYINLHVFLLLYFASFFRTHMYCTHTHTHNEKKTLRFRLPVCKQMWETCCRSCNGNGSDFSSSSSSRSSTSLSKTKFKVWLMLLKSPLLRPFAIILLLPFYLSLSLPRS